MSSALAAQHDDRPRPPPESQDERGRKEPPSGFEPETPILPRWCATTAPQRQETPGLPGTPPQIIGRPPLILEDRLGDPGCGRGKWAEQDSNLRSFRNDFTD